MIRTALAVLALAASACAAGSSAGPPPRQIAPLALEMPATIQDLVVVRENVDDQLEGVRPNYAQGVALHSLRDGDLLQATLQVVRLRATADPASPSFRDTILNQVGGTEPTVIAVSDTEVWLSAGTQQRIASWISGRDMFVLAIRDEYPRWRGLIRRAVEMQL